MEVIALGVTGIVGAAILIGCAAALPNVWPIVILFSIGPVVKLISYARRR